MSLCDHCYSPGHCCKRMALNGHNEGYDIKQPSTYWTDGGREGVIAQLREHGLPFEPLEAIEEWTDAATGRPYAAFWYSCPRLGPDGRCTDYENRPQLCRTYQAGSDGLCVHFMGAEGVDLVEGL